MSYGRIYAITWLTFAWTFVSFVIWQAVVALRARAQARREQTAATVLYGQGVRVLDGVYDVERDPDALPTRIVSGARPVRSRP